MTPTNLCLYLSKTSAAVALTLIAAMTQALPGDREQPIKVRAENFSADQVKNQSIYSYSGKVVITQGSLQIRADRVEVYVNDNGDISRVVAIGKPAHFQQQVLEERDPVKARAQRIEYKVSSEDLHLTGEAYVDRDGNTLAAEKIDYDLATEQMSAQGQAGEGRVEMIWQPEKKEDVQGSNSENQ